MPLIDCTLSLDNHDAVVGVQWSNPQLRKAFEQEWSAFVGQKLSLIPDFRMDTEHAKMSGGTRASIIRSCCRRKASACSC